MDDPRAAVRKAELRYILEPWADNVIGLVHCAIYCRTFLGVEIDIALAEGIEGGWIRKEPRRFLDNPHPDAWDYLPSQDAYYWWRR